MLALRYERAGINSVQFHTGNVNIKVLLLAYMGVRGSVVVKTLCYKLEGRGFETQ
jgi:hypothetical protein